MQSGPAASELAADANDCIMVRSSNRSTEYKAVARDQRNTNGELASDFHRRAVSHLTSNQVGLCDAATNRGYPIREPAMRSVSPQANASCRRARSRQGRCAPLTRWAEDGPILDCRCARRPLGRAAGAEEWLPPGGRTKEMEKEEKRWKRKKIALDNERPIQGFWTPATRRLRGLN